MKLITRIWQNVLVYAVCAGTFAGVYWVALALFEWAGLNGLLTVHFTGK